MTIVDLLVQAGVLDRPQVEYALSAMRKSNQRLVSVLLDLNLISETALQAFLALRYQLPPISLGDRRISPAIVELVDAGLARKHNVIPVDREGHVLTLAMTDPADVAALDDVAFATGLRVRAVVAVRSELRNAIERHYNGFDFPASTMATIDAPGLLQGSDLIDTLQPELGQIEVVAVGGEERTASMFELKTSAGEAPVIRLVNRILMDAVERGASDVHIEPFEDDLRVRFRVDGVLYRMLTLRKTLEPAVMSRLKIMADLDIAERRLPQDGRMKLRCDGREIDMRLSLLPTLYGEKALLRVLDRTASIHDLGALGFEPWAYSRFQWAINQPHGMILITGPTGSGKTTTLYAAVEALNSPGIHIMTAEDPVEYRLPGVNQVQINEGIGRTFAATLRSFLRQDPDVILVGETRDAETAQISARAALTGHLVLSTLHTNDCPSTLARLTEMGTPSFLIASSLLLVVAQRLVRKVCEECREASEVQESALVPFGLPPVGGGPYVIYRGKGCAACHFTGMKQRMAIYEVMPITEDIRDAITHNAPIAQIRSLAQQQGMRTLREAGLARAIEGLTTVDEVIRVTMGCELPEDLRRRRPQVVRAA